MIMKLNVKHSSLSLICIIFASFFSSVTYADPAKDAWLELVGEQFSTRAEFAFVENNPELPNVLIYGDSISIHYTQAVRAELENKANVYRLYLNGGDSSSFIRKMTKMHTTMQNSALSDPWTFEWDVIHFNVGLHDLKYTKDRKLDKANGKQVSSIEEYENNLRNIVKYLKTMAPSAKLIFATTTPIPEGEPGRIVGDAAKYNAAGLNVLKDHPQVIVNDLYNFTKPHHLNWWAGVGNVHYNELGRKAQGGKVASVILSQLTHSLFAVAAQEQPNIVILYADDLGMGDLGSFNINSAKKSKIPTPNLDQLAAQGMSFTDAHSSSGICSPSRYALLTGRYHWRKFHSIVKAFGPSAFSDERLTLPEMLQQKGYTTTAIGKWHLGWDWDAIRKEGRPNDGVTPQDFDWSKTIPDGPTAHGFDYYFGDTVINFPPYVWIENDKVTQVPDTMVDETLWKNKEGKMEYRPGPMITGWDPYENIPTTTQKGIDYITKQAKQDKPFFLYFAYPSPHAPIIPNDEFDNTSKAGPYGDLVVETDDSIGKLLTAIKEAGIEDNTIVIFSSDNGPEHYAYLRDEKFDHWSSGPYRGVKRDIYEGGHRVPMIVRWPNKVPANNKTDELVSQIDIMATVASLIGFELPDDAAEDSYNLLPLWTGKTSDSGRDSLVHNTFADNYAIRSGDWSFIVNKSGNQNNRMKRFNYGAWQKKHGYVSDDNVKGQLFDMKNDAGQRHNLIEKHPKKASELLKLLQQIQSQGLSTPR